jgi:hypothetical protein
MYQRTLKYIRRTESFRKCRAHLTLVNFFQLKKGPGIEVVSNCVLFFYTPCIYI